MIIITVLCPGCQYQQNISDSVGDGLFGKSLCCLSVISDRRKLHTPLAKRLNLRRGDDKDKYDVNKGK